MAVDYQHVVTAAEMERLSPDERARLLNDRVITDLSQVSPAFLSRVLVKGRRLVDEHRNRA